MDAFHLAMLVCAGLLVIGALVSWFGLRADAVGRAGPHRSPAARRSGLTGLARGSAADAERRAVAGDDDVGGRQDPLATALDRGLVEPSGSISGVRSACHHRWVMRVDRVVGLDDERGVLLGVAGRQPQLGFGARW